MSVINVKERGCVNMGNGKAGAQPVAVHKSAITVEEKVNVSYVEAHVSADTGDRKIRAGSARRKIREIILSQRLLS